jgi:hypothetical protein
VYQLKELLCYEKGSEYMQRLVTPESYLNSEVVDRVIGIECEYNLQNFDNQGHDIPLSAYCTENAWKAIGVNRWNKYLGNGGGLYLDVGHIEYDTQEELGPRRAAARSLGGDILVASLVEASGMPHQGLYRISGSSSQDRVEKSSGFHESYLTPRSVSEDKMIDQVLPSQLASRVWSWSGIIRERYNFSQKIAGIGGTPVTRKVERRTEHGNKPMIMIPPVSADSDTIGSPDWARIEVRLADPIMSPTMLFLALAAMSLSIRLVEQKRLFKSGDFERLELLDPVAAAHQYSSDLSMRLTQPTRDGRQVTAMDLQENFAELYQQLNKEVKLPKDEIIAIDLLTKLPDQFRKVDAEHGSYGNLIRIADLAARHTTLTKTLGESAITNTNKKAFADSLLWDRVLPSGRAKAWWAKKPSEYISAEEISSTAFKPSTLTRGMIRAEEINDPERRANISSMNWAKINRKDGTVYSLDDAYATTLAS